MNVSAIALQGLDQASAQLDAAATSIARAGVSPNAGNLDVVNLGAEMVALRSAQTLFACNLASLKIADQTQKSLVDITA